MMNNFKTVQAYFLLLIMTGTLLSCGPKVNDKKNASKVEDNNIDMTQAHNNFAFKLFKATTESDQTKANELISPLSIYADLGMLLNGAVGNTQKEMQSVLGINHDNLKAFNQFEAELMERMMRADSAVQLDIANSIWYRKDLMPKKSFLEVNKKYHHAQVEGVDFGDAQTINDINGWVNKNTHGKIPTIIDQIDPSEVMFLINAVYFKGDWTHGFREKQTRKNDFYLADNTQIKVPFMYQERHFNYLKNDDFQMVELPYGKEKFSMYVLLPNEKNKIFETIRSLDADKFSAILAQMKSEKMKLYLPKWEASYEIDNLKDELSQMGMPEAFQNNADFSNLFKDTSTKVSQVKHKTYIKVDEKGTEAAAATSTGMMTTSINLDETKMQVNHPFIYFITEKESDQILFMGVVYKPEAK